MRMVKTTLFLLLILAISLFAARLLLLERISVIILHRSGAENVSVHFSSMGLQQTDVETLAATFILPDGELISITLHNTVFQYSLQHLLATGKCDRIIVETMDIRRTGNKKIAEKPLHFPEQVPLLSNRLRSRLPFKQFSIQQLLLHGDLLPQLTEKVIRLKGNIRETAINSTIHLQADSESLLTAELTSPDAQHLTVDIIGRKGDAQIVQAGLLLQPDNWSGTLDLQLDLIQDLLVQFSDLPEIPEIDGSLTVVFSLPFPLQNDSAIQAEVRLHDSDHNTVHLKATGKPINREVDLFLTGHSKDEEFVNLRLAVKQERMTIHYSLQSGLLGNFLEPYLPHPLPEISGALTGKVNVPMFGNKDTSFFASLLASSPALAEFRAASAQLELTGEMTDQVIHLVPGSQLAVQSLILGNSGIDRITLDLAGRINHHADWLRLIFAEQQILQIQGLSSGRLQIADLEIQTVQPLQINFRNKVWSVETNTLHVSPLLIRDGERTFSTSPLICRFMSFAAFPPAPELSVELATPAALLTGRNLELPVKTIRGTLQLIKNSIQGKFSFAPAIIPGRVRADFTHNPAIGATTFTLRTDKRFDLNRENISLAALFTSRHFPFDLDSGRISFKIDGSRAPDRDMQLSAFVAVTEGSGYYRHWLFKGLAFRQNLVILPRIRSKSEGSFSLQQLIGTINVNDVRAGLNFSPSKTGAWPQVQINGFSASLFDGTISCPALNYDLNKPDSSFTVNIKGMDLAPLVKLVNMDHLYVSGRISGSVPVSIRDKTITVDNGHLYNDPPGGVIRYTPTNMNQSGITGYALKAVEDFRYDTLETTAQYSPGGQLDLDISLKGTSPKLSTSRPVHLNIHAEQNLPTLMQSLRFSKGLTEELDKRVKQQYK